MPDILVVKAGETLDVTGYVEGAVFVSALSDNGSMGTEYKLGSVASDTEFAIATADEKTILTPPTDEAETQYIVK